MIEGEVTLPLILFFLSSFHFCCMKITGDLCHLCVSRENHIFFCLSHHHHRHSIAFVSVPQSRARLSALILFLSLLCFWYNPREYRGSGWGLFFLSFFLFSLRGVILRFFRSSLQLGICILQKRKNPPCRGIFDFQWLLEPVRSLAVTRKIFFFFLTSG